MLAPSITGGLYSTYVRTTDSDEWVARTFRVQKRHVRVLLVCPEGAAPATIDVAEPDLNAQSGAARPTATRRVTEVFRTLQAAIDASRGGDLVAIMPGRYESPDALHIGPRPETGDGRYVYVKALGPPGAVVIRRIVQKPANHAFTILLDGDYIVLDGLHLDGTGTEDFPAGSRAGVLIYPNYRKTGRFNHHVAVINCLMRNHRTWGLHAVECHSILIQDSVFADSRREHGVYLSNGADNCVVRRNVFQNNAGGGLQCNLDLSSCLQNILRHPDFKGLGPQRRTRKYARKLIATAEESLGRGNVPDGWGVNYIIERNVVCGNGRKGGGAFNLAGLRDSVVQNNLLYGNVNHGITLYNDSGWAHDRDRATGPAAAEDFKGEETLTTWGSCNNIVRNNTVLLDSSTRFALPVMSGCYGNRIRNNILVNGGGDSVHVTAASIWRHDSGYNVTGSNRYVRHNARGWGDPSKLRPMAEDVKALAVGLDESNHSRTGVTPAIVAANVVRAGEQPWVLIENGWWRLNPDRPDFRPLAGSALLSGAGDPTCLPPADIDGRPRTRADLGAYAAPDK